MNTAINLSKDDLEANLGGHLSSEQAQHLRQQRILVGLQILGLGLAAIGLVVCLVVQHMLLILIPLILFWMWLLRNAPRQLKAINQDLQNGDITIIEGPVRYDIRFTPGMIRLARYRIFMQDHAFAVEQSIFFQLKNQDEYRVYYAPHSEIFLGAVPLTDEQTVDPDLLGQFTPRELDILERLAAGLTNKEIADDLYISVNTVKSYVSQIYRKLNVNRRTEAAAHARKLGII